MAEQQASIEERISATMAPEAEVSSEPSAEDRIQAINAPEVTEEVEESSAPTLSEADEPDEEPEALADDGSEDDVSDGDETVLESIGDLAGFLGVDVSELYNVSIPINSPDGVRKDVTLGEWKDSYQLNEKATETQRIAQEEREALNARLIEITEYQEQESSRVQSYVQAAQQELTQEFNGINWEQLRAEDPSRYAVQRQDFIERNGRLQQMGQAIDAQRQEMTQKMKEQRATQLSEYVQRERRTLAEAIPEWRNEETAQAEKAMIADHLMSIGYRPEDLEQVYDHRIVMLARDAMRYREQAKSVSAAKKKVVKVSKSVLKPGARRSKATNRSNRERDMRDAMRKGGGRVEDAAAIIQARLGR